MDRSERGRVDAGDLVTYPHAHVLGVEGRGMSGLAQCLATTGMEVTASATGPGALVGRLGEVGVRVRGTLTSPYSARTRLLVHGPQVRREHPVRLGALRRGIRQETPSGWLGDQMRGRFGVVFAGGREASVSAAMSGYVLAREGLDPTVVLNRLAPQLGGWARGGDGPHFVADWPGDADGFFEVRPRVSVLLNVGTAAEIDRDRWAGSLRRFASEVPDEGHLLALGHPSLLDDDRPLWEDGHPRREWISLTRGADWWGTDLREDKGRPRLRVFHRGRFVTELRLRVSGRANVVAALAAVAACDRLGISTAAVRQGVEEFNGLSRDFESRGSYRGVTLVDDEAEDAGSMRDALSLARRAFGGRRLWAVCAAGVDGAGAGQVDRFLKALSLADRVLILEPGAGPDPTSDRDGRSTGLAEALAEGGLKVCRAENLDGAISELDRHLEPGDVVLTLGAGDVGTIADAFIRRLSRDRQAG